MNKIPTFALCLLLGPGALAVASAAPVTVAGPGALALATIVGEDSPLLSVPDKRVLARLFDGHLNFPYPANQKISVKADAVVCRVSDVDLTARSCGLTFGTQQVTLKGRRANELDATAAQAGVPPEGAAGSIFTSFKQLVCVVDPNEIKQKAGGGANCTFNPGP